MRLRDRRAAAYFVSELEGMIAQHRISLLELSLGRLTDASPGLMRLQEAPFESAADPARTPESAG